MDKSWTVKTGDALLFSGNSSTGFLLRTFVATDWNHAGIAVRIITTPDPSDSKKVTRKISLTEDGELYILETNTGSRYDDIFSKSIKGAGFSKSSWVFSKYNRISVRRLKDTFRTELLAKLTLEFAEKSLGIPFPSSSLPFLGIWLGVQLSDDDKSMFCSEMMTHYYTYVIGKQYKHITGTDYNGELSSLFGNDAPLYEDMYTPEHYSANTTPNSPIFVNSDQLIYLSYADLLFVIIQPLILCLLTIVIIYMLLPV